jgi:4a-hydroxytetrahydrobiopterin dehydratase
MMCAPAAWIVRSDEMADQARGGVLDPDALAARLQQLSGWTLEDGKLVKSYTFADFLSAVAFVDRLTPVAQAQDHHPELVVAWGRVTVHLWSDDVRGITARDIRLAAALDEL